jgi:hypothetical protein
MTETFCPATMCPLFASEGSPWTGTKNAPCDGPKCGWFQDGHCMGGDAARQQIAASLSTGVRPLQLHTVVHSRRGAEYIGRESRTFDCPRAADCQWQIESGSALCPPRAALAAGLDPRACAY